MKIENLGIPERNTSSSFIKNLSAAHSDLLRVILKSSNVSDDVQALSLVDGIKANIIHRDKGYDSKAIVSRIELIGARVVSSPKTV